MIFLEKLVELDACEDSLEWVGCRTLEQAWAECPEPSWLVWLAKEVGVDCNWRALACEVARTVLYLIPEGEHRPRLAVEAAERYLADPSESNRAAAYSAADAAYSAAYSAADAAYSAARAVRYADDAANAAEICKIVSRYVNVEDIRTRLELR